MISLQRLALVLGLVLVSTVGADGVASAAGTSSSATVHRSVQRTFLDGGKQTVVDKRNVSLTVSTTTNLHSLQLIDVSWTGAHPTGGLVADQNSDLAGNEEYPFALFECRGVDSAAHPLTPDTCWTQYADERFTYGADSPPEPAWRSDSAATAAQRAAIVGAPAASSLSTECRNNLFGTTVQRWVPFDGANGTKYAGGPFGCAGLPPEAAPANLSSNLALPSNETYGVTQASGAGSATFDVFTNEDHASLGCSSTVACSLVAVPIEGLSCDPSGSLLPAAQRPNTADAVVAKQSCEAGPRYKPGQLLPSQGSGEPAVEGALWWSPSNWANRLAVPLTFAPADNACSLTSSATPVDVYGSELMIAASTQWAPIFCLNKKLFDLTHVQTPEPQARSLLATNNIEAAYTSEPPDTPYPNPTVDAPVTVTGFGIGYTVDDSAGKPVTNLRLDARLLAKLLSESYPAETFIKTDDKALSNNPLNITADPEFQALNPGIPVSSEDTAATLLALNTDSDVMYALSSYINADPEARAWLDGTPDPWGMTVNPNYKKIALPVNNWPLLDSFEPLEEYKPGRIDCLADAPVPYLPLVAAPTARLFSIGQDIQFALSQSQTKCVLPSGTVGDTTGAKMVADGRQSSGNHAMLGVVSLGDAAREGLDVASLETHTADGAATKFTDAAGRSFAAPTQSGLRAAAATLRPDAKSGVWPVPYATLRSDAANAGAYPGTMVVYAAVPTKGLPTGDGPKYAKVLQFAAGPGQHAGTAQGQLPPGYLPMTTANGLGGLAAYTLRAANAVAAQRGYLPSLTKADPRIATSHPGSRTPASGPSSGGTNGATTGTTTGLSSTPTGGDGTLPGGTSPVVRPSGTSTTAPKSGSSTGSPNPLNGADLAGAKTPSVGSGIGGWVLPVLLLIAVAALGVGIVTRLGSRAR